MGASTGVISSSEYNLSDEIFSSFYDVNKLQFFLEDFTIEHDNSRQKKGDVEGGECPVKSIFFKESHCCQDDNFHSSNCRLQYCPYSDTSEMILHQVEVPNSNQTSTNIGISITIADTYSCKYLNKVSIYNLLLVRREHK